MAKLYYRVTDACDHSCDFCFYKVYGDRIKCSINNGYVSIKNTVSSIELTSIMISCGKSGTREDNIDLLCVLKQSCKDIIVFNNGLFIEKHFDYIMKFGWKELRFQVSIPNNGLQDNIINKVRTLVGNGFWVDGYITVDVDFEQ